jgi:hypothetical protein
MLIDPLHEGAQVLILRHGKATTLQSRGITPLKSASVRSTRFERAPNDFLSNRRFPSLIPEYFLCRRSNGLKREKGG